MSETLFGSDKELGKDVSSNIVDKSKENSYIKTAVSSILPTNAKKSNQQNKDEYDEMVVDSGGVIPQNTKPVTITNTNINANILPTSPVISSGSTIKVKLLPDFPLSSNTTTSTATSASNAPNTENSVQTSNGKSSSTSSSTLNGYLPSSLHPLFTTPTSLSKKDMPKSIRSVCSSLTGTSGQPILKFSELFAPTPPSTASFLSRKKQKIEPEMIDEVGEPDQMAIFHTYQEPVEHASDNIIRVNEELQQIGQPLSHETKLLPKTDTKDVTDVMAGTQFKFSVPERLDAVQQVHWEDKIIWDKPNPKIHKTSYPIVSITQVKEQIPPKPVEEPKPVSTEPLQTTVVAPPPLMPVPFLSNSNARNSEMAVEEGTVTSRRSSTKKTKLAIKLKSRMNEDLEIGNWTSTIIWDEENQLPLNSTAECADESSSALVSPPLVLDLNDYHLFPEDPTKKRLPSLTAVPKLPQSIRKRKSNALKEDEIDSFNLSNDQFYRPSSAGSKIKQNLGKTSVIHSIPAIKLSMVKTHLLNEDLKHFHRPRTTVKPTDQLKIVPHKREKMNDRSQAIQMKHKSDLSAKDGRVVLMEYTEENPLVIMNAGMGTKVRNYYKKKHSSENPLLQFLDGENILLDSTDESPFLGDVEPGKSVQSLDNNLFRAPIFKHSVPETDFLMIKSGKKFLIREIPTIYAVGQEQPKLEIPAPNSRVANNFVKARLQAYIYRLFKKKKTAQDGHRIRINEIMKLFPGSSETAIRKRLKECADFQRGGDDSGWWIVKDQSQLPNEEEFKSMVSPEAVCLYESMLLGQYRLHQVGARRLTNVTPNFSAALAQMDRDDKVSESMKSAAHLLEEELLLTPWNLSSNFVAARQGKGMLQLSGLGDPSGGRGEAFSYVRMPIKQQNLDKKKKKDATAKAQVTGTDADLRKLSLENAREVLLKFGVPDDQVQRLGRWERIALVRKYSSEAATTGEAWNQVLKFARGSRYSLHQQQMQYKEQIQMIWDNQARALSETSPQFSDDDEDVTEDLDEFGKDLESLLDSRDKRTQKLLQATEVNEEEETERVEYEKLIEQLDGTRMASNSEQITLTAVNSTPSIDPNLLPARPLDVTDLDGEDKPKALKRKVITKNADGTTSEKVELITDPTLVDSYLQKEKEKARILIGLRKSKTQISPEEEEERQKIRKERRRLQEQLRRLRKNKEKQDEFKRKMLAGEITEEQIEQTFKCGACGLPGHMRTNRQCPLYNEPLIAEKDWEDSDEEDEFTDEVVPAINPEVVKVEGNKLKFPKDVIANKPLASPQIILRFKKDQIPPTTMKKRGREEDEYIAKMASNPKRTRRWKGAAGAMVALSNAFEKVLTKLKATNDAIPFAKPVNAKEAPDYYSIIKRPIDLSAIRDKNRDYLYKNRDDFLVDIKLMVENCHTYNTGRNPHLLLMADNLQKYCSDVLQSMDAEITEYEQEVIKDNSAFLNSSSSQLSSSSSLILQKTPMNITEQEIEDEREISESFFDSTDTLPAPSSSVSNISMNNNSSNPLIINESSNDSVLINYETSNDATDLQMTSNFMNTNTNANIHLNVNTNSNSGVNDGIEEEIIIDQ